MTDRATTTASARAVGDSLRHASAPRHGRRQAPPLPLVLALLILLVALPAAAQKPPTPVEAGSQAAGTPAALQDVGFDQNLGARIPLDLQFVDADGHRVRLGDYFAAGKPVILSPVYYECPMLCDLTLNGLAQSLKPLKLTMGEDFEVVSFSFDPGEDAAVAAEARARYVPRYGRDEAWGAWHFLTGEPEAIAALTDAIGFRYEYDAERDQFAHAAGIVMLTPDGTISRYFFGTDHPAKDLRLGLVDTGGGSVGTPIDRAILFCYSYDPSLGRYSADVMNLLRAGGAITVIAMVAFIVIMVRRERRQTDDADAQTRTA